VGDVAPVVAEQKALAIRPAVPDHAMHGEQLRNQPWGAGRVKENADAAHKGMVSKARDTDVAARFGALINARPAYPKSPAARNPNASSSPLFRPSKADKFF
jgi:hypothetical protein